VHNEGRGAVKCERVVDGLDSGVQAEEYRRQHLVELERLRQRMVQADGALGVGDDSVAVLAAGESVGMEAADLGGSSDDVMYLQRTKTQLQQAALATAQLAERLRQSAVRPSCTLPCPVLPRLSCYNKSYVVVLM
jgi:hypothetical protein